MNLCFLIPDTHFHLIILVMQSCLIKTSCQERQSWLWELAARDALQFQSLLSQILQESYMWIMILSKTIIYQGNLFTGILLEDIKQRFAQRNIIRWLEERLLFRLLGNLMNILIILNR